MASIDRWPVVAKYIDGPYHGRDLRLPPNLDPTQVPYHCVRVGGGEWSHYERLADGNYHFGGTCTAAGHTEDRLCDVTWPDPTERNGRHECLRIGAHDEHQCCCGDTLGD